MLAHELLKQLDPSLSLVGVPNATVNGVTEDSRQVRPGYIFVARAGTKTDGLKYIQDAKTNGAIAVVCQTKTAGCPLPQVVVPDTSPMASLLSHAFLDQPSRRVRVLGVTGTNGKTTTTYLIRHILNKFNTRCGMVGTVETDDGKVVRESTMTTPGSVEVAELLASMRDKGCRACAIETSSHALHQGRVAGVRFTGAAFLNLTGDHLDYHGTMEEYAASKARLFEMLEDHAVAVINADDKWSARMIQDCHGRIIRFGFGRTADYRARDVAVTASGSNFILHTPDGRAEVNLGMIGRHNIENALAAGALVGEVFGLSVHQIAAGLKDATGAPGRLQSVRAGQPFSVLVDYAHTDDALENVLTALRPLCRGKLRVLFGCGGDRDRSKRPRMARVAARLADVVYVTSDNPRTEQPDVILDDICRGFTPAEMSGKVRVEIDRHSAIERILSDASDVDVVLLAGKGHENYQIIGTTKHPFDDVEESRRVIQQMVAV